MDLKDAQLDAILDALDVRWPQVAYRVKAFPDGQRHARLRHPDGGRAILFAHEQQWVLLSESALGTTAHTILGRVGDSPETIAERMRFLEPEPSKPGWSHALLAVLLGLSCSVGVALLTASVLLLLARGHRYTELADLYWWIIVSFSVIFGVVFGGWATRVVWARPRHRSRRRGSAGA
ncbi:hypothetical protein [Nonomuraea sp. NPDC050643]|uniref:hypothetical protein n=1 Tax=Nonomuraea sp. NPDC050643 TaxID=3155660 RepID=UPI0033BFBA19